MKIINLNINSKGGYIGPVKDGREWKDFSWKYEYTETIVNILIGKGQDYISEKINIPDVFVLTETSLKVAQELANNSELCNNFRLHYEEKDGAGRYKNLVLIGVNNKYSESRIKYSEKDLNENLDNIQKPNFLVVEILGEGVCNYVIGCRIIGGESKQLANDFKDYQQMNKENNKLSSLNKNGKQLLISSLHSKNQLECISSFLKSKEELKANTIITGDFNCGRFLDIEYTSEYMQYNYSLKIIEDDLLSIGYKKIKTPGFSYIPQKTKIDLLFTNISVLEAKSEYLKITEEHFDHKLMNCEIY